MPDKSFTALHTALRCSARTQLFHVIFFTPRVAKELAKKHTRIASGFSSYARSTYPAASARATLSQDAGKIDCAVIGLHKGDFSPEMLWSVKPLRLQLVDPWEYLNEKEYEKVWHGGKAARGQVTMDSRFPSVKSRFSEQMWRQPIVLHRYCSADAASGFTDGCLDWIYIDGNLLYEYVKADLEMYYPKV